MKQRICSLMLCLASGLAWGQAGSFPAKPIRIMVPFNAGSGADSSSRFYGDLLANQPAQVMSLGPAELRAFVAAEYERFKRVAQAAGIEAR